MSTQYGRLSHRQTVQVPMWLIVALLVGAVAIGVGYTVEQNQGSGAVAITTTHAVFLGALETSGVIRAAEAETTVPVGLSHVAPTTAGTSWQPIVVNGSACHQCR